MDQNQQQQGDQVSEQDMITAIVKGVNDILGRHYSLYEFDEMPATARLQILADIFMSLSPQITVDFKSEPLEQAAGKTAEFLTRTLGYKIPPMIAANFERDFLRAEAAVLYPIMYWVLKRMPENRKRVYLARYLTPVEVPEEMVAQDDGIREIHQRYVQLRQEFIETHKRVEQLKAASADPTEARRKIADAETERDQLAERVNGAQRKLQSVPNKEAFLTACTSLRKEQEEQFKLQQKYADQQNAAQTQQRKAAELANRLRDVRRDIQENRLDAILQRMNDDLETNKITVEQTLPQELNEKRMQNAHLQKLQDEPLDMASLTSELSQLDREIADLSVQVQERQRPSEDGTNIQMMKAQVQRVQKKKNEVLTEYNGLAAENQRLMDQMGEREQRLNSLRNSKVLKGDDFKRFDMQYRQNVRTVNSMKTRLFDLRGELGVLQYTEKVLRSKHEDLQGELSQIENKLGARGYVQAADALNTVANEKNVAEAEKGKTLEQLSQTVQELVTQIRDRRNKLAPQILELRNVRNQAAVVEQEYEEKKSAYEYQQSLLMQEVIKLETEVNNLSSECRLNESLYHRIQTQMNVIRVQQLRVEEEKKFRQGQATLDERWRTHAQMFHSTTEQLEVKSKDLHKRRRDIEENHEGSLQQVEWFTHLKKLLECKLAVARKQQQELQGGGGGQQQTSVDQDIRDIYGGTRGNQGGGQGVDMLVLGGN